jgi:hypothetical protein
MSTKTTKIVTKSQAMHAPGAQLKPLVTLTKKEWMKKYKPRRLALHTDYGRNSKSVEAQINEALDKNPCTIWTELDTGERRVIVNGWCFVNREAYYISEVPFDSLLDVIEVPA